jgi:hypothetical protein
VCRGRRRLTATATSRRHRSSRRRLLLVGRISAAYRAGGGAWPASLRWWCPLSLPPPSCVRFLVSSPESACVCELDEAWPTCEEITIDKRSARDDGDGQLWAESAPCENRRAPFHSIPRHDDEGPLFLRTRSPVARLRSQSAGGGPKWATFFRQRRAPTGRRQPGPRGSRHFSHLAAGKNTPGRAGGGQTSGVQSSINDENGRRLMAAVASAGRRQRGATGATPECFIFSSSSLCLCVRVLPPPPACSCNTSFVGDKKFGAAAEGRAPHASGVDMNRVNVFERASGGGNNCGPTHTRTHNQCRPTAPALICGRSERRRRPERGRPAATCSPDGAAAAADGHHFHGARENPGLPAGSGAPIFASFASSATCCARRRPPPLARKAGAINSIHWSAALYQIGLLER